MDRSIKTQRAMAENGLPLKIQTEWTDNDYWERIHPDTDDMKCINVAGWLVRINGKKYPRGNYDGDGELDWTYRYTSDDRRVAIDRALTSAGLKIC